GLALRPPPLLRLADLRGVRFAEAGAVRALAVPSATAPDPDVGDAIGLVLERRRIGDVEADRRAGPPVDDRRSAVRRKVLLALPEQRQQWKQDRRAYAQRMECGPRSSRSAKAL